MRQKSEHDAGLSCNNGMSFSTVEHSTVASCIALGEACFENKQLRKALLHFTKAALLAPEHVPALMGASSVLLALSRPDEAALYAEHAVALSPNQRTLSAYGQALYQMGNYAEALTCFVADPNNAVILGQRALCLTQLNRYDEALQMYQQAQALTPNSPVIQSNYAFCLLAMGNLRAGFQAFEWRWQNQLRDRNRPWILPSCINTCTLQGKSILIHTEQGLGDSLQFFRYIPLLANHGARVILEIQPALIPLLSSWSNVVTLIGSGSPLPVCDYHCPIMSLAFVFQTDLQSIPTPIPYVYSEAARVESYRNLLTQSSRKRVGLAWRGSSLNQLNHKRSIALEEILTITHPNIDFICLQNNVTHDEKKLLDSHAIPYYGLELSTFEGTAALISCLDLVVTIDTSIAHLAGAMGKSVWILLPFSPDWRWLLAREDSPWYPSAKLFRQTLMDVWQHPLAHIKTALAHLGGNSEATPVAVPCALAANKQPSTEQALMSLDNAMVLASQLQSSGQLARAQDILNRILQVNPKHAHALHLLGVIAHQVGKIPLGIQFIQNALASDASVALFHSNLGEMHRQLKALDLSIESGLRAIKLDPHSAAALSNLGIAYYDAKNYDQATACHQRALLLNPQLSNSLNNMGSVHKERKNVEEAMRYYQAAIASSPGYAEPLNNLGALLVAEHKYTEAIELFHRALMLIPDFADAYCNLGFALHGLEQNEKALLNFQRALELKPMYAEAYIGLCKLHSVKCEFDAAKICAKKAIEINAVNAEFYQCLAEVYADQGVSKQALYYFDYALAMDPTLASAKISKANLLLELGEAKDAEALLSQTTSELSTTTRLSAHCSLMQLRTAKPHDKSMEALLSIAKHVDTLAANQQETLYFALGKGYDDIAEWSTAFKYFAKGCQMKRSRIAYSREDQTQFAQRIINNFTPNTLECLRESANPSALPLFVLGMPRSGTTLIEQIIASHPSVHGAGELSYLSTMTHRLVEGPLSVGVFGYPENVAYLTPDACSAIADEYLTSLRGHDPEAARITDKMPGNFVLVGLIHALFPNAKIIHVERNPIDTCLSCYTKLFRHGQFFSYDLADLGHFYANYRSIMAHWRRLLPVGSFLDVRYEAFVEDLESEARQLIDYCGLEWDPACLAFHTTKRQVRTASLTQVRRPIYSSSVERWRRFEHELEPLIHVLREESCL